MTKRAAAAEEKSALSQAPCLLLMGSGAAPRVQRSSRSPPHAVPAAEQHQIQQQIDNDAAIAYALSDFDKAAVVAERVVRYDGRKACVCIHARLL